MDILLFEQDMRADYDADYSFQKPGIPRGKRHIVYPLSPSFLKTPPFREQSPARSG
jgi:nucleoside phosphorylase